MTEQNPIQVGQDVPDFELTTFEPTTGGFGKFSLKDAKKGGKWTILVFYPADFTFVCATEFAALAQRQAQFEKLGAKLVTVSCDTQFTHLAWQREEKELADVKYSMGADHIGEVARLFGVYLPDSGLTLRGMAIDLETRRSRLAAGSGGLSGPAIKPVALRMVHELARAVRVPVVGIGGIRSGEDALEFLCCGASAVQVGTATFYDPAAPVRITAELRRWCATHGVRAVRELIGTLAG